MDAVLEIRRSLGDRRGEGWAHYKVALVQRELGALAAATTAEEVARGIADDVPDTRLQAVLQAMRQAAEPRAPSGPLP